MAATAWAAAAEAEAQARSISRDNAEIVWTPSSGADGPTTELFVNGVRQTRHARFFVGEPGMPERPLPAPSHTTGGGSIAHYYFDLFGVSGLMGIVGLNFRSVTPTIVAMQVTFDLRNETDAPLSFDVFAYLDPDVRGTRAGDAASPGSGSVDFDFIDGDTMLTLDPNEAVDAFEVANHRALLDSLEDAAPTTLTGAGVPSTPADLTWAGIWRLTIPARENASVGYTLWAFVPAVECGNGLVETSEACDDGNTVDETECPYGTATCMGCDATCTTVTSLTGRVCGDGTTDPEEECDDGGAVDGDGCSADCALEEVDAGAPAADGGAGVDGGADAGADLDGGRLEADAGIAPSADSGVAPRADAGSGEPGAGGCACRAGGRPAAPGGAPLALLALAALAARRRARRRAA